jgi:hypothetical protein
VKAIGGMNGRTVDGRALVVKFKTGYLIGVVWKTVLK